MTALDPSPSEETSRTGPLVGVIVIISLLLATGLGGWFVWRQWIADPQESAEFDVGTVPDRYRVFGNPANQPRAQVRAELNKDGIHPFGVGFFRVKSGDYYATLAPAETTFAPMQLLCSRNDLVPQPTRVLLRLCNESVNAGFAKNLSLTPDQLKKLAAIRLISAAGMKLEDADRDKLRTLWKNWNTAKDPAAKDPVQAALLAAFQEVGARSLEPTRKQYNELATEVRKIVSDQQLATYRSLRGG